MKMRALGGLVIACWFLVAGSSVAAAAKLRIRESVLEGQKDRATIVVTGVFDHVGKVNSLGSDCDLHSPVHAHEIRVAVQAESMNAGSTGPKPGEVEALTAGGDATIEEVFRVWLEHPGKKDEVLTEEKEVPDYSNSTRPHAVEIHPVSKVGDQSFLESIKRIEKDGKIFAAKGTKALASTLKKSVKIHAYDGGDDEEFIVIESPCCLPNYFRLTGKLAKKPVATDDGHFATVDIYDASGHKMAAGLRVFSVAGTATDDKFTNLKKSKTMVFWAITRLNLDAVLQAAEDGEEALKVPVEFVLFDIE